MAAINTPVCEFGKKVPMFSLSDPDGNIHNLNSVMGKKGLLVIFMCNHCPFIKAILDDLLNVVKQLQDAGIGVVGIMSNNWEEYEADSPENMQKLIEEHDINFPYLVDEEQSVAKEFGAVCTPDFFGYSNKGELQYRGRFDGRGRDITKRSDQNDLLIAMLQLAETGNAPELQVPSIGCSIKWKEN